MPSTTLTRILAAAAVWSVAAALLWWGRLAGPGRRALAVLASAAGLVFLVVAINTEGVRESPTMAVFLLGTPYVTEQVSASASLPYYVLTGVCLLLGTAGLAVSDEDARRLSRGWMATAIGLSLLVTALRFCLDKVAAPPPLAWMVGVAWLAPVVGAYFLSSLRDEGKTWRELLRSLVLYGFVVRGVVAALYVAASTLHLGSHYDVSAVTSVRDPITYRVYEFQPGSFAPVLFLGILPQVVVWPVYTVVGGLLGAGIGALLTSPPLGRLPSVRPAPGPAAAGPDQ